jgi:superfamily I DNA/RNA helicase
LKNWVEGLNPEQSSAVLHNSGPLLILAGAGSGKTTVLVARAGRLIQDNIVSPERLCVLTFTNKAARELKARVQSRLGQTAKKIWAGTFHSFGLSLLRKHYKEAGLSEGFGIIDQSDAGSIIKELLHDFRTGDKTAYDSDRLLSMISDWRESGRTGANKDEEYEEATEWLLPRYLKRLQLLSMVDFDGLILKPLELLKKDEKIREQIQSSFSQVMVDEFQDTNQMQMDLVRQLVAPHRNVAVVGDDDQSIYGWRGAKITNILNFPKLYSDCVVVRLERNYRSTPAILNLANAIIANNAQRHHKQLRSKDDAELGDLPECFAYPTEDDEAENVCNEIEDFIRRGYSRKDVAVLYRSNGQGALIEAELRKRQVPYSISGGTAFFDRKETRDLLAYLRCSFRPNELALRRILNTPPRGIGEKSVEHIAEYMETRGISFVEAARCWREAGVEERAGAAIEILFDSLGSLTQTILDPSNPPGAQLLSFFDKLGYRQYLEKHAGDAQRAAKRWRYMELFSGILTRYMETGGRTASVIKDFTDAMELRDLLSNKEDDEERVQLLTLHACKGLEFPVVFLLGVEEDILPHKVLGSDVAEERRLFYVGVTRAQKRLILTRAEKRRRHGRLADAAPSRFLVEIPKELIQEHIGPRPVREDRRKSMVADLFAKLDSLEKKKITLPVSDPIPGTIPRTDGENNLPKLED